MSTTSEANKAMAIKPTKSPPTGAPNESGESDDSDDSLDILLNGVQTEEAGEATDDVPIQSSGKDDGMAQIISMLDFYFRDSQTGANLVETLGFGIHMLGEHLEENTKAVKTLNNNLIKLFKRNVAATRVAAKSVKPVKSI